MKGVLTLEQSYSSCVSISCSVSALPPARHCLFTGLCLSSALYGPYLHALTNPSRVPSPSWGMRKLAILLYLCGTTDVTPRSL